MPAQSSDTHDPATILGQQEQVRIQAGAVVYDVRRSLQLNRMEGRNSQRCVTGRVRRDRGWVAFLANHWISVPGKTTVLRVNA